MENQPPTPRLRIYPGCRLELVDADLALTKQAAVYKAEHKMSYADCFAAALAKVKNSELVTGDLEFKEVEKEIKITWLNKAVP